MSASDPLSICFICMGNICRSPLAESVFLHKAKQRGVLDRFVVDSAGTGGWHVGEPPDPRVHRVAAANGVKMQGIARQITKADFDRFDWLICMDQDNRDHLLRLGAPSDKVRLLLECDPCAAMLEVPDPYYGGQDGFELCYKLIDAACDALLDELLAARKGR